MAHAPQPKPELPPPERDPALQKLLEDAANDPTGVMGQIDLKMSPELTRLLEKGLIGQSLPAALKDSKAAKAFQQAFEMIGGVPRLALWADQNPSKFYQLYSKMVPITAEVAAKTEHTVIVKYSNPNFNKGRPNPTGGFDDGEVTDVPPERLN